MTNARLQTKSLSDATTHSPIQIIFDIWRFKMRKEKVSGHISARALAKLYADNLAVHTGETRAAVTTIEAAQTVYEKVFRFEHLSKTVISFGRKWKDCLTITKLLDIAIRCRHSEDKMTWVFASLEDRLKAGAMEPGELTSSAIKCRTPGSSKAILELLLLKKSALDYFLTVFLDTRNFGAECKQKVRNVFETHESYRRERPLEGTADTTWMAFWPPSALRCFQLIETLVYLHNSSDEAILRTGMRNIKTAKEIVQELLSSTTAKHAHNEAKPT